MSLAILSGMPRCLRSSQSVSRSTLSNALSKSMNVRYSGEFHSRDYSIIILLRWLSGLYTISLCESRPLSSRGSLSISFFTLSIRMRLNTSFGIDSRVIPLQFEQSFRLPFFGSLIRWPCLQSSGISSVIHVFSSHSCCQITQFCIQSSGPEMTRLCTH